MRSRLITSGTLLWMVVFLGTPVTAEEIATPSVIAVKFHADWCGGCRKLAPAFSDLISEFNGNPVLFVTLDRTDKISSNQAELLATALEIDRIYQENPGTGFILLIDPNSHRVLERLHAGMSKNEMAGSISKLLRS